MTDPIRMLTSSTPVPMSIPNSDKTHANAHALMLLRSAPTMSATPKMIAATRSRALSRT